MSAAIAVAHRRGGTRSIARRPLVLAAAGVIGLLVVLVAGVAAGSVFVPPGDTVAILAHRLLGLDLGVHWTAAEETIVFELRLPRVLMAMTVGVGLAVAGTTFQGLLRNPLADPYVLGTASGAALGAAVALLLPVQIVLVGLGLVQLLAFGGAVVAVVVVYRLARVGPASSMTSVLLTGYAVGSLLAAGLALTMYLAGSTLRQIFFYLLGSFSLASWPQLALGLPLIVGGSLLIIVRGRSLNALLLGEEMAAHLGLNVRRERVILLGLATLVTAAAVAIAGLIGFVGLIVPQALRMLLGPDIRVLVPAALLAGGAFLLAADTLARTVVAPAELSVGVLTSFCGAPVFIWLLRSRAGRTAP